MKDFSLLVLKTHITLRIAVLNILVLMPFFFIYIYMFHYQLIEKINTTLLGNIHFWYIVFLCLCFSVVWFYTNLILSVIACFFLNIRLLHKAEFLRKAIVILTMIYSVVSISFSLFINFFCNLSLVGFRLLFFLVCLFLFGVVIWGIKNIVK